MRRRWALIVRSEIRQAVQTSAKELHPSNACVPSIENQKATNRSCRFFALGALVAQRTALRSSSAGSLARGFNRSEGSRSLYECLERVAAFAAHRRWHPRAAGG